MPFDHDNPVCASLGHYIAQLMLVWCPHRSEWLMFVRVGDDADDVSWRAESPRFGPFDPLEAVETEAIAQLRRALRADHQAWRHRRDR